MAKEESTPRIRKRKPHFYWWTLANAVAICVAVLSWVLCTHIFGQPEIPWNYKVIKKLGVAKPAVGFRLQEAPPGEAADPRALYRRYAGLDAATINRLNRSLMRNYLTELREGGLIQYVEGTFQITDVRRLTEADLFHPGFAVRGRAMVQPDEFSPAAPWPVTLDYLFPTANAGAAGWFTEGDLMEVSKVPNCAMLLHVATAEEEETKIVRLTAVPIAMGAYQVGEDRSFRIETPGELDPGARFPAFAEAK